jgi:hypothetical protein
MDLPTEIFQNDIAYHLLKVKNIHQIFHYQKDNESKDLICGNKRIELPCMNLYK